MLATVGVCRDDHQLGAVDAELVEKQKMRVVDGCYDCGRIIPQVATWTKLIFGSVGLWALCVWLLKESWSDTKLKLLIAVSVLLAVLRRLRDNHLNSIINQRRDGTWTVDKVTLCDELVKLVVQVLFIELEHPSSR